MTDHANHGADYEAQYVHSVYEEIASHFSSTRYKPWPIVERFLKNQPRGAIGADVGCGNGKYLAVNTDVFIIGSDRSTNLIKIAKQHAPHSTLVADNLSLPHPPGIFDFAISIAVIHHLSTSTRRVEAVKSVLELLRPPPPLSSSSSSSSSSSTPDAQHVDARGGRALIYVWALEQKDSRRGWDEGHEQDVMVPWVLKHKKEEKTTTRQDATKTGDEVSSGAGESRGISAEGHVTYLRYYHLYRRGELESDVEQAGGVVLESGYEKDNWWAVAARK